MIKEWLSLLFPPLCKICKEPCETVLFCPLCWEECTLIDPASRCRHCFAEAGEDFCSRCRSKPALPYPIAWVFEAIRPAIHLCEKRGGEDPSSLAAFALAQWDRLDWPIPDKVIPFPGALPFARAFADWLERPCVHLLSSWRGKWSSESDKVEEDQTLLLFSLNPSLEGIQGAIDALSDAFPKKIFVLSLLPLRVYGDKKLS